MIIAHHSSFIAITSAHHSECVFPLLFWGFSSSPLTLSLSHLKSQTLALHPSTNYPLILLNIYLTNHHATWRRRCLFASLSIYIYTCVCLCVISFSLVMIFQTWILTANSSSTWKAKSCDFVLCVFVCVECAKAAFLFCCCFYLAK